MQALWEQTRLAAERVCHDPQHGHRIANLSILCALAFDAGLHSSNKTWNALALRRAFDHLALSPLPKLKDSARALAALAEVAHGASAKMRAIGGPDEWVQAFQGADANRKSKGAYATASVFAEAVARAALQPVMARRASMRIVDPSAGAGAFLLAAMKILADGASNSEIRSLVHRMHGVEIDEQSRELCCLLLWLDTAKAKSSLKIISKNVVVGNAITFNWWEGRRSLFDVLLMNPPWESLRHSVSSSDPHFVQRSETSERLAEQQVVSKGLPPLFSAQGRGDRNLFKAFVELAPHLIREGGRIGALIPAAFASDLGMSALRALYFSSFELDRWTTFENRRRYFPIDSRYKFGVLVGTRSSTGTTSIQVRSFSSEPSELTDAHAKISMAMISKLGGPSRMLPELSDRTEARVLERMFQHGSLLFETDASSNRVRYRREFDLTLDKAAKRFMRFEDAPKFARQPDGSFRSANGKTYVPLVEGRMVGRYDIFQKSWVQGEGRTAIWEMNDNRKFDECTPQYVIAADSIREFRVAICDVTSATNTRTVHAALVPTGWSCGNSAPVLEFPNASTALARLAILNSLVFDWMARRIVGGLHLNKFYLATLVWPRIETRVEERLAKMALQMMTAVPRSPSCITDRFSNESTPSQPSNLAAIEAAIEREVATAFNLDAEMLRQILSPDRKDRRGFWRYFAANPPVFVALQEMLRNFDTSQPDMGIAAVA